MGAVAFASVDYQPPSVLRKIAEGQTASYSLKGVQSMYAHFGDGPSHELMRTIYRTDKYGVGTGFYNYNPPEYYVDSKSFNIVYKSGDVWNTIEAKHKYWRSDESEAVAWARAGSSIFQQNAQDENVVISLFNIPKTDPWAGVGRSTWTPLRDGHTNSLIQRADIRYPKTIDEKVESNGWIFLRENDVYIAIKPLQGYTIDTSNTPNGFNVIRSSGAKNAVIFELGTANEHGSFTNFRSKISSNSLTYDLSVPSVTYTESDGDKFRADWVAPNYAKTGRSDRMLSKPNMWRNGVKDPAFSTATWPVMKSPYANLDNRILTVELNGEGFKVDWSGSRPIITYN